MDDYQIIENIKKALSLLIEKDNYLLNHDLSEQCISHKFAEYIQLLFPDLNVDCEYNGNIERQNGRKKIILVKNKLRKIGLLREVEETDTEKELTERAAFPDIIIHKRGLNEPNLCIIETKKSTSSVSHDYDFLKLESYTTEFNGNDLNYQLGIFILFLIDKNNPSYSMMFFKNGHINRDYK